MGRCHSLCATEKDDRRLRNREIWKEYVQFWIGSFGKDEKRSYFQNSREFVILKFGIFVEKERITLIRKMPAISPISDRRLAMHSFE